MAKSTIGELVWKVTGDTKDINKKLASVDKNTSTVAKGFNNLGKIAKAAITVKVIGTIARVSGALLTAASDAEETANKFGVTFSGISEQAEKTAEALASGFGLSSTAAKGLLADTGDLLTGFGFTQTEALNLSTKVNELAVDLASFTNFSGGAKGASDALTKGLLGEREAMKSLGIAITEADIKQLAEEKGIVGEIDRQTKAALTLELALIQSKNAIGDFERSSDSFANQQRIATAAIDDFKVSLGQALIPVATESLKIFSGLTERVTEFINKRRELKEAEEADQAGLSTTEQKLLLANNEIKALSTQIDLAKEKIRYTLDGVSTEEAILRVIEEETGAIRDQLNAKVSAVTTLQYQLRAEKELMNLQGEARAEAQRQLVLEQDRQKQLQTYLDLVAGEYAKTKEGQIEQQREEVELWERYAETAINTAPQVQAILEAKREKLEELTETTDNLNESTDTYLAAIEESWDGAEQARLDELNDKLKESEQRMLSLANTGIGTLTSGFAALGEELVQGELSWNSFAKVGLNAVAATLEALGAQLATMAAVSAAAAFIPGLQASALGAGPALAGSAAAYASAGVVKGVAGSFEQGGIIPEVPGASATGDKVLAAVNPGERVVPEDEFNQEPTVFEFHFNEGMFATAVVGEINKGKNVINLKRGAR